MINVFREVARRSSRAQIRHVAPVPPATATGLVAQVYDQLEREFGMLAPPVALHAPAPGVLAASWLMLRETLIATGAADRAAKEAVGAAVSRSNACPYCVDVHSATLDGLAPVADSGRPELEGWAMSCATAGSVSGRTPFGDDQAPELIGTVVTFHYLNRMVNVFLRETPFPPGLPGAAQARLLKVLVRVLRPVTRATRQPGESVTLLPAAPLPGDLAWAAGNPHVAAAFAAAVAAVESAADASVTAAVRDLVTAELAGWTGDPRGPSRAWAEESVAALADADRPAGRLALLTALASYQIDAGVIEQCRAAGLGDRALIELTSWASLSAARRVGSWTFSGARRRG